MCEGSPLKILVVPPYDWLGYPNIPTRYTHIFERIAQKDEVHVLRFRFGEGKRLATNVRVHEMDDTGTANIALYYLLNAAKHYKMVSKITRENGIDIVVNSNLLAAYMAAKAADGRSKVVFDLCDHFPSSAAGYYFDLRSTLGKIVTCSMEKLLKRNLRHAEHVVASSHALLDYVRTIGFRGPVSLMPNGVDDSFLERKYEGGAIREKCELEDSLVIGYLGSVEFWLDMLPLLSAVESLKDRYDIKLLIVGSRLRTNAPQRVRRLMRSLRIEEKVVWPGHFVPYHEVPFWISAMDICTIPFNHVHPTAHYSAPIKLFEYLAAEKPVLSTPVPEVLITAKDCVHIVVTEEDYKREIESYLKDPTSYLKKAREGKLIATKYSWTDVSKRYRRLLAEIAEGRATSRGTIRQINNFRAQG